MSADQITRTTKAWPTHPTCNGNCNQGRACDCTADADEWEPLSARDHLAFWVPVVAVTVGALAVLLYAMGVRL